MMADMVADTVVLVVIRILFISDSICNSFRSYIYSTLFFEDVNLKIN